MSSDKAQVDNVSGQTTTGHEWDGIRELNTPLPRWWLWLFYLTIAFAFVYWIVYPAWPLVSGYTPGFSAIPTAAGSPRMSRPDRLRECNLRRVSKRRS